MIKASHDYSSLQPDFSFHGLSKSIWQEKRRVVVSLGAKKSRSFFSKMFFTTFFSMVIAVKYSFHISLIYYTVVWGKRGVSSIIFSILP